MDARDTVFEKLSEELANSEFLVSKSQGRVLLDLGDQVYEVVPRTEIELRGRVEEAGRDRMLLGMILVASTLALIFWAANPLLSGGARMAGGLMMLTAIFLAVYRLVRRSP